MHSASCEVVAGVHRPKHEPYRHIVTVMMALAFCIPAASLAADPAAGSITTRDIHGTWSSQSTTIIDAAGNFYNIEDVPGSTICFSGAPTLPGFPPLDDIRMTVLGGRFNSMAPGTFTSSVRHHPWISRPPQKVSSRLPWCRCGAHRRADSS